ncbi:MAG: hypothetical protein KBB24_03045 [Bacteroidales bacterium]|nr:hypothetical protein [Bacteroidales bacterium]
MRNSEGTRRRSAKQIWCLAQGCEGVKTPFEEVKTPCARAATESGDSPKAEASELPGVSVRLMVPNLICYLCIMVRQRHFEGLLLGLTFLFLCYGIRGYYPRYNEPLQEDAPFSRTAITEGNYPELLILNKGTGNPADALKQPPAPFDRTVAHGLSDLPVWSGAGEIVKETAFRSYAGTVYIDVSSTDLIFPFHYFL